VSPSIKSSFEQWDTSCQTAKKKLQCGNKKSDSGQMK
jgi:hypothetical protein